jgi:fructose transport system substrate-binding protein
MIKFVKALAVALTAIWFSSSAYAGSHEKILVCLITKTESNPFFVKMREGAKSVAKELGVELQSFSGKFDTDNDAQVAAVENCVAAQAKGILITPALTRAIVPAIEKAREAGVIVIALDTELDPNTTADATFATDNFLAGILIGKWAKAQMGSKAASARIGFLDIDKSQPTVGVQRDQGFMQGFGIDIKNPNKYGDEDDPRIVGHYYSQGNEEGGRSGMETLLQKDPSLNVLYTLNEPAAAGAYEALKAVGKENDVLIVSVDGGCPGVRNVRDGVIGATSMQFPLKMADYGVRAIVSYIKTGMKPGATPGKAFYDTGVQLITDKSVDGIDSVSSKKGLDLCWG